jgi:hypothetical protein
LPILRYEEFRLYLALPYLSNNSSKNIFSQEVKPCFQAT